MRAEADGSSGDKTWSALAWIPPALVALAFVAGIASFALDAPLWLTVAAIGGACAAGWTSVRNPTWYVRWSAIAIVVAASAVSGLAGYGLSALLDGSGEPRRQATGEVITVSNKVTDGPAAVREDEPLRLFFSPQLCGTQTCVVPGPGFRTGNRIDRVVRQTSGQEITNGEKRNARDDTNPQLVSSSLWYGVSTDSGRLAYFSEVWAEPNQRGGLQLPDCSSSELGG